MAESEKRAVTIMPATALNHEMFEVVKKALESHKATTAAHLICLDNRDDDPGLQQALKELVESLGYEYVFKREEFSLTKFWNAGADMVEGKFDYVVYANADVLFHNHWLHYLLEAWAQGSNEREYFSMHPYVYSPIHRGQNYRASTEAIHKTQQVIQPQMHCSMFRVSDGFRFDAQFQCYECDCDYWFWLKFNGLKAGINYASRVDHTIQGIHTHKNSGSMDKIANQDRIKFFTKWETLIDQPANDS